MTTITFDTHKFICDLQAAGLGVKESEAITNAIKEANTSADLATKRDVQLIVSEAKADMVKWVAGMLIAQSAVIAALVKLL